MTFEFDTGERFVEVRPLSAAVDETQAIHITTHVQSARAHKKIRANIAVFEDVDQLDAYWRGESLMLDALHLYDPHVAADLADEYRAARVLLQHAAAYQSAPLGRSVPDGNPASTCPQRQDDNGDTNGF